MILLGLIGFIIGLTIPAISSRFGKILPADPGVILLSLWHKPHFPKIHDVIRVRRLHKKWMKLFYFSIGWGIIISGLFIISKLVLPESLLPWAYLFHVIIAFCIVIDSQYCLLPDFFTIPLLFLGFGMAAFTNNITPVDSVAGSCFGYLLATISVVVLGLFKRAEFGAGDVKMMTAVGAWLGAIGLNVSLFLSFFIFALYTALSRQNAGPYGPALGIAAIIILMFIFI